MNKISKMYKTYTKQRNKLKEKGISLYKKTSRKEFEELYYDAVDFGDFKNFATKLAKDDQRLTYNQSRALFKETKNGLREEFNIYSYKELRGRSDVHNIISRMFELGLIEDRDEFEKSLGY